MLFKRDKILELFDQGFIKEDDLQRAMEISGVIPDRKQWYDFIEKLLLWIGILFLALSVVFFVAYNWDNMGRVGKIALLEAVLAGSLLPLVWIDMKNISGKILLFGASIITGALLALVGQIYQTGADTWQLFAIWAVLIAPLALLARFGPLWVLLIMLVNVAYILFYKLFFGFSPVSFFLSMIFGKYTFMVGLVLINSLALIVWEYMVAKNGLKRTFCIQFPALFSMVSATNIVISMGDAVAFVVWAIWFVPFCIFYKTKAKDISNLTLGCISAIIVGVYYIGKLLSRGAFDGSIFFFLAIFVILAVIGASNWLKSVYGEWQDEK